MYKCPKCGAEIQQGQGTCNCGTPFKWPEAVVPIEKNESKANGTALVLKCVSVVFSFLSILAGLLVASSVGLNGLIISVIGIIISILIRGFAEVIYLLQDIKDRLDF